ncbi:hypothetical protein [Pseudomonas sp.]|uniref:hypothetical protein n=1 Tax=Pseudomonas sp. TaxID=306 RepID=UPI003563D908
MVISGKTLTISFIKTAHTETAKKTGARIIAEIVQALIKNTISPALRTFMAHSDAIAGYFGASNFTTAIRRPRHA